MGGRCHRSRAPEMASLDSCTLCRWLTRSVDDADDALRTCMGVMIARSRSRLERQGNSHGEKIRLRTCAAAWLGVTRGPMPLGEIRRLDGVATTSKNADAGPPCAQISAAAGRKCKRDPPTPIS